MPDCSESAAFRNSQTRDPKGCEFGANRPLGAGDNMPPSRPPSRVWYLVLEQRPVAPRWESESSRGPLTLSMRAILAGFALTAFFVTPTLADYYIVQEPTTKRCRIVEERPAPSVGVVIGGVGFGVRTEAESRMRTECRESGTSGGDVIIEERERRPAR